MASLVVMLQSETVTLRHLERPALSIGRFADWDERNALGHSANSLTISDIGAR